MDIHMQIGHKKWFYKLEYLIERWKIMNKRKAILFVSIAIQVLISIAHEKIEISNGNKKISNDAEGDLCVVVTQDNEKIYGDTFSFTNEDFKIGKKYDANIGIENCSSIDDACAGAIIYKYW